MSAVIGNKHSSLKGNWNDWSRAIAVGIQQEFFQSQKQAQKPDPRLLLNQNALSEI